MNAIILAAGLGQRLRPFTDDTHKALLSVGGETVLARIVSALLERGIEAITIVTGYRAADLRDHLAARFPGREFHWVHNPAYATANNIVSLHLAMQVLPRGTGVLTIESDLVFDPALLDCLLRSPHPNVALVDRHSSGMDGTVVTLDSEGAVTAFIPRYLQEIPGFTFDGTFKTVNIYKFSPEFCDRSLRSLLAYYVHSGQDQGYYELVLGVIAYMRSERIHAELAGGPAWKEIDNPVDLEVARAVFGPGNIRARLDQAWGGLWNAGVTDFCYPRNMYFPDSAARKELSAVLDQAIVHYSSHQSVLDAKLARYLGCAAERVVLLNGLSQVFPFLARHFAGFRVLVPAPTYGEYSRAFPDAATYSDEVGIDFAEVEAKAALSDVVVFVNPNNPTGSRVEAARIAAYTAARPGKTILVDESFSGFSGHPGVGEMMSETPDGTARNLVVLRSLGKALGVPGLRLGYVESANHDFLAALRRELPVWNVNSVAEAFLEIILKHRESIEESLRRSRADRDAMAMELQSHPLVEQAWNGGGNFLLARLRLQPERLGAFLDLLLERHGLYLKDVSGKFRRRGAWVRIAVRTPDDNRRLLECMAAASPAFSE